MDDTQAVLRRGYVLMNARDVEGFLELCDPGIVFESRITALDGARYEGHAGVRLWLERLHSIFETLEVAPLEIRHGRPGWFLIRARFQARGRGSGGAAEQIFFHVVHLSPENVVLSWHFPETAAEAEALAGIEEAGPA